MRLARYSASSASSSAAARSPSVCAPSRVAMASTTGRSGSAASTSLADTRSPVVTGAPSSTAATSGPTSSPPSSRCAVSAVARRSRCSSTACSRPSSPDSNSSLPRSTSITVPRSTTRATGSCSPRIVERCRAAAATVSAAAIANRADTPERWSIDCDSRRPRANRARICSRYSRHRRGQVRLLVDDADLGLELQRVVRADLGAEPVLERGDDAAAVGVVLGVGAGHDQHVERQPQRVAADLDVALLHHVEHRHLDALGEVGQLVDGDDAAVRPRDQAEGDGLRIAEAAALGHLDGVDVTDQVGDAGVRRGELLGVALAAVPPRDRQVVTRGRRAPDRLRGDRACTGARRARSPR